VTAQALPATRSRDLNKYLSIRVASQNFGIGVLTIKEIIEYGQVTSIPMMPSFVCGTINLRGHGVPVLDLAARFGGSASQVSNRSCIVIVEAPADGGGACDVGLLVDAVDEVVDIAPEDIESAPSLGGRIRTDFFAGMGKVKGRFVLLLDIGRLLAMDELEVLYAAAARGHDRGEET